MLFRLLLFAAQALLSDWLSSKLRLEMEDEEDLMCSADEKTPAALAKSPPATLNHENFNGNKAVNYPASLIFIIAVNLNCLKS